MSPNLSNDSAQAARIEIRRGLHQDITYGLAPGFVQCNLVVIRQVHAYDFLLYCQRNQRACPLLEVTEPGSPEPTRLAPGADLRTDLPRYNVYQNGELVETCSDLNSHWESGFISFLIGSGITFDQALNRVGINTDRQYRWVVRTSLPTEQAGPFRGNLVATMRWLPHDQVVAATQVTSRFPFNHGAPIHIGAPETIGADLEQPLHGPRIEQIPSHLTPVFWACGVTPQAAAMTAGLDLMITHAPAHGFITDLRADDICTP